MADYVTTEPAFDFERGDFVIINGRPKMVVGMDRLRSWIGKVLRTQKGRYKIYNGTSYGTHLKVEFTVTTVYGTTDLKEAL